MARKTGEKNRARAKQAADITSQSLFEPIMILTFITELFESAKKKESSPYFPAKKLSNRGVHLFLVSSFFNFAFLRFLFGEDYFSLPKERIALCYMRDVIYICNILYNTPW